MEAYGIEYFLEKNILRSTIRGVYRTQLEIKMDFFVK